VVVIQHPALLCLPRGRAAQPYHPSSTQSSAFSSSRSDFCCQQQYAVSISGEKNLQLSIRICFFLGKWTTGERKCPVEEVAGWCWMANGSKGAVGDFESEQERCYRSVMAERNKVFPDNLLKNNDMFWFPEQLGGIEMSSAFFGNFFFFEYVVLGKELRICNNRNGKSNNQLIKPRQ